MRNFILSGTDLDDVIAYILSLKRKVAARRQARSKFWRRMQSDTAGSLAPMRTARDSIAGALTTLP